MNHKVMIFSAGLGTRLKPLTNNCPKALVKVNGLTLLEYQLKRLSSFGFNEFVINIHHFSLLMREKIIEYSKKYPYLSIKISDESKDLLNTGGAIKFASPLLYSEEPILLHNVDILTDVNYNLLYDEIGYNDVLLLVSDRVTSRYLLFDVNDMLCGWTNIKTGEIKSPYKDLNVSECKKLAFSGVHLIQKKVLKNMEEYPDKFSIIDFYLEQCSLLCIKGIVIKGSNVLDVGKPETLLQASDFLKNMKE